MMKNSFITVLLACVIVNNVFSQEVTKWRGPSSGIYSSQGLLKQWPQNGPEILWAYEELGEGYSSVSISDGFIYLPTMVSGKGLIYKFSMDGKLIWKSEYGQEFTESYPGSRASVTVAGDLLYMLSGMGKLACLNASDGKVRWRKDLFKDFDGENIRWGLNETLIVDGDMLICTPGGKKHNVISLNRHTGELIWASTGKGEKSAYCSPLLIQFPSRKLLVTHSESHIMGIDASNGKLLWSHPWPNQWSVHANTPIFNNGMLFCFSGYGQGSVMLELKGDGLTYTKKWETKSFDSRMGGAVIVDGYIYGSGDKTRSWQCLDVANGNQMYASTAIAKGAVIYADGMLYCYSERGELALVKADPTGFNIVSQTTVSKGSGQHWAHPVIHEGVLYLQRGSALIAYKIK